MSIDASFISVELSLTESHKTKALLSHQELTMCRNNLCWAQENMIYQWKPPLVFNVESD